MSMYYQAPTITAPGYSTGPMNYPNWDDPRYSGNANPQYPQSHAPYFDPYQSRMPGSPQSPHGRSPHSPTHGYPSNPYSPHHLSGYSQQLSMPHPSHSLPQGYSRSPGYPPNPGYPRPQYPRSPHSPGHPRSPGHPQYPREYPRSPVFAPGPGYPHSPVSPTYGYPPSQGPYSSTYQQPPVPSNYQHPPPHGSPYDPRMNVPQYPSQVPPRFAGRPPNYPYGGPSAAPVPYSNEEVETEYGDEISVIAFINPGSGGQKGQELMKALSEYPFVRTYDLKACKGPKVGLEAARGGNVRILACGGDGTVNWVLSVMDEMGLSFPVAILPLGTGNDLSRALGWGPGFEGGTIGNVINRIDRALVVPFDRWRINCGQKQVMMNNYFSIGVDAAVCLAFHKEREANPNKFKSRLGNKIRYGWFGMKHFVSGTALDSIIVLEMDGQEIEIPKGSEAIIVLNIGSYGGGCDIWGRADGHVPSSRDKKLEVVRATGSAHLGRIAMRMAKADQIGVCSSLRIRYKTQQPIAVQVDGEPWMQQPGDIDINLHGQVPMLSAFDEPTLPSQPFRGY